MAPIYDLAKAVFFRFLRGAFAGAIASMATIAIFNGGGIEEIKSWIFALAISGFAGAIGGGILALDKYIRESISK